LNFFSEPVKYEPFDILYVLFNELFHFWVSDFNDTASVTTTDDLADTLSNTRLEEVRNEMRRKRTNSENSTYSTSSNTARPTRNTVKSIPTGDHRNLTKKTVSNFTFGHRLSSPCLGRF